MSSQDGEPLLTFRQDVEALVGEQLAPVADSFASCECDFEDNRWLHVINDLSHIFNPKYMDELDGAFASHGGNISETFHLQMLASLVYDHRHCAVDASLLRGTNGVHLRFAWGPLAQVINLSQHSDVHSKYLTQFCLPGQVALDLICSQYFALARPGLFAAAQHRARRLAMLLPAVTGCLSSSVWPLEPTALEAYASQWAAAAAAIAPTAPATACEAHPSESRDASSGRCGAPSLQQLVFRGGASLEPREKLPALMRRCLPLRPCWPAEATGLEHSCTRCCDPRYPRGQPLCFDGPWTFETCCAPDDLVSAWPPAPPEVEEVFSHETGASALELRELREELRRGCPAVENRPGRIQTDIADAASTGKDATSTMRNAAWAELRRWLADARQGARGGTQRVFPELDLLVSTNACVGPQVENPWFIALPDASSDDGGFTDLGRDIAGGMAADASSGVELAAAYGALCGPGPAVAGELVSHAGPRASVPCEDPPAVPGEHRLEPYGLELMRPCRLARPGRPCPCGRDWCDGAAGLCCYAGKHVEWRKLGLLTGELRTNIAHFARDALWLHHIFRRNTSIAALAGPWSEAGGVVPEVVLTKHAATECIENDRCVKTGRSVIFEMEQFLANVALDGAHVSKVMHSGDSSRTWPLCYEVVAQRWRPWAGDGNSIQAFRRRSLQKCGLQDRGLRRKIVVLRRDSISRQWRDEGAVKRGLEIMARSIGSSLFFVNLGQLSPCEQVDALHDAMLMLAVHGADMTNMIFLPRRAAVVELAVECEVEGSSVDGHMWRGPGTLINGSVMREAAEIWRRQSAEGICPEAGELRRDWLQGYPISQFAKLARQANLLYTAVMDCSGSECRRDMGDVADLTWCTSDMKKRQFVEVELETQLLPTVWAVYDGHLRRWAPAT